jgi:ABC-type cobalamin/Fe3+-siderophores transport system ATPase subunit
MSCAVGLKHVSVSYYQHVALRDVSLSFHKGDFVGVIGPNGAGKTTLLTIINGLGRVRAGEVEILGQKADYRRFRRLRQRIGYVPQHVNVDPRAPVNCREAVMMGRLGRIGILRSATANDSRVVDRMMELTGIKHLSDRPVGQISGGERQKVALARALAQEPDVLLLDEPTTNLDPLAVDGMKRLVVQAYREFELTVVTVTHQLEHLPEVCNKVVMMKHGRIVASGTREETLVPQKLERLFSDA